MTFIDLTKNQIYTSGSPKICCYCDKQFIAGDIITLNKTEDIVHLKCNENAEREMMAERLKVMTKDELIDKLRRILKNEDNYNDWALLDRIQKVIGKDLKNEPEDI
jgi:hypothetical protein